MAASLCVAALFTSYQVEMISPERPNAFVLEVLES